MSSKILKRSITILLLIGLWATGSLVYKEYTQGNICPQFFYIPACYIILFCFSIPLLAHLRKWSIWWYYIPTLIAFCIAFYGTMNQLLGTIECPKNDQGFPMCYLSMAFFGTLILLFFLLKKIEIKSR